MSAKYQFFKTPRQENKQEEKAALHARVVESSTVRMDDLCNRVSMRTTFQQGEVRGIAVTLIEEMINAMKDGDKVEIDGLGMFYPTLTCPPVTDPKEIRAESIHFSRVVFRGCQQLRKSMKSMQVERSVYSSRKATDCPDETRRQQILDYLQKEGQVQSSDCMRLNHCSRYMAQHDLKALKDEGLILRIGGPKVAMYILNQAKPAK